MPPPRHPAGRRFVESGLFTALSSFSDLERRIAALPEESERGAAFEEFAEAFLSTQRIAEARQVWPTPSVPYHLRQRLRLDTRDMGVDGVLETHLGEITAYQVKFRSGRPSVTWQELSTFFGLTDHAPRRLLFTNCDSLPALLSRRTSFSAIRGADLDRLERGDFEFISAWLRGRLIPPSKKEPRPHQSEALDAILGGLRQHSRVTAIMPCGTGKTLVQLWVAEGLSCGLALVLLPSLALLRQTLHEWLKETRWKPVVYLGVCSDPTVERGLDEIVPRPEDLDFPITTDSKEVRKFLSRPFDGVKLVFCTYHSASVVAKGLPRRTVFDLAVFDEAHRTAGRRGSRDSFALSDRNLPATKRLFMTATPRHYDVHHRNDEGDAALIYSMDRPDVYGPVAYKLSFAEAVRQGIIVDYKVLVSVVTSQMVDEEVLRRGEVSVQGDSIRAMQVANQIALAKAIDQHDIRKVITFHGSVKSAKSFTASDGQGIRAHVAGCDSFHVNGEMPSAEREGRMKAFRDCRRGVVSNARCLTEGIDVPSVDMTAFLSPKRSRIDIVQATGRAMRTAQGKTTGYVFLPLFLREATAECVHDAVRRGGFDEIWTVLQALKEHDEPLAETIREMRETKGRTRGFDDRRFREKVLVLGPEVSLEILRAAITSICVDKLSVTWDERYGQLVAFKEKHGHCSVLSTWAEDRRLATWVSAQRKEKDKQRLANDRIAKLDGLGFVWAPFEQAWEEMYSALADYRKQYGHCDVPQRWPVNRKLAVWVMQQGVARRHSRLSDERIRRLDDLGFVWNSHERKWDKMFSALVEFKQREGRCNVSRAKDRMLSTWVKAQRSRRQQRLLSAEQKTRLDSLEFDWKPFDDVWERMFAALVRYKQVHGDLRVRNRWAENRKLGVWVGRQRTARRKGDLSHERVEKLNELGFEWDLADVVWNELYQALSDYRTKHGHCNVEQRWSANPRLGQWVATQRKDGERLSAERRGLLDRLGFVWDPVDRAWEQMFAALLAYGNRHGHYNVPLRWPENPRLGRWVGTQRQQRRHGVLDAHRVRRLNDIRFEWAQVGGRKRVADRAGSGERNRAPHHTKPGRGRAARRPSNAAAGASVRPQVR